MIVQNQFQFVTKMYIRRWNNNRPVCPEKVCRQVFPLQNFKVVSLEPGQCQYISQQHYFTLTLLQSHRKNIQVSGTLSSEYIN